MPWILDSGVTLAEMAMRGSFESLHTLKLLVIKDETDQAKEVLN